MALETIEREHTILGIPPRELFEIVTDYACYPRIFPDFSGCRVLRVDGRVHRVEFRARKVVEVRYVLDIVHDPDHLTTRWSFVDGEVVSDSEGGWEFLPEGSGTRIRYRAGLSVKAPLPKLVVNRISNAIAGTSIPEMFRSLEREARARKSYRS